MVEIFFQNWFQLMLYNPIKSFNIYSLLQQNEEAENKLKLICKMYMKIRRLFRDSENSLRIFHSDFTIALHCFVRGISNE